MLRATRRLLRSGGRTAFTVIHLPPGLSAEQRDRALDAGPAAVATRSAGYEHLLRSAGFRDIDSVDVTEDFLERLTRWVRYGQDHEDELTAAYAEFGTRLAERLAARAAVSQGLLRRSLYVARRA